MQTNFKPAQRIRITHLILTEQPQEALSRTFTIAETYPMTNCVSVLEDIGCVFHMSQIELVEPSFQFTVVGCEEHPNVVYTAYHPYDGTDDVLVTWPNDADWTMAYSSFEVDKWIGNGMWKVVQTASPPLPDEFKFTTTTGTYKMSRGGGDDEELGEFICDDKPTCQWQEETIKQYLADGTWKFVEAEKSLPDVFTFHTRFGDLPCKATRILNDNYEVRWGEGIRESQLILQESVIKERLANRDYTLAEPIPEVSTIEQEFGTPPILTNEKADAVARLVDKLDQWRYCMSYNDSYFGEPAGLVKSVVKELSLLVGTPKEPLKAAVDDETEYSNAEPLEEGCTAVHDYGGESEEICVPQEYVNGFLDLHAIKRFTADYPASIFFDSGKYVMYFEDDELYADTDTDLFELMQAIRVMSAARGK
jgi:hypothetical protein